MTAHQRYRIGVDIGGTFTDFALFDDATGEIMTHKRLTTPDDPSQAVVEGVRTLAAETGIAIAEVATLVHGTTLVTNALIERRGAPTAMLVTAGFRDTLDIGLERRYDLFDLRIRFPAPLVPRRLRFEVGERIAYDGTIRATPDFTALEAPLETAIETDGIESVAICFLHSYLDPRHERAAAAWLAARFPRLKVSVSSDIFPFMREFERWTTTCMNAFVQPVVDRYVARLEAGLATLGFAGNFLIMTSSGGTLTGDLARRFPVRLLESGPAAGALMSARHGRSLGLDQVLSFDMGGTTAKICLIEDGQPQNSRSFEVDRAARFLKGSGLPLRIPVIEMVEIGAGGGSIARIDQLGRIAVGPDSAASEPGPACYGRGGTQATVTDADLAMGRIDPDGFAAGRIRLDTTAARTAIDAAIGAPQRLATELAAFGIAEMVDETMASAARVHAVERGKAIGAHTMIAFGGAAPLHAARVAEKLGIARVVVPANAGVGSAIGFLRAPVAYEVVHSRYMRLSAFDPAGANALIDRLAAEARAVVEPGAGGRPVGETRGAFMRYVGQGHEILVPIPARALAAGDEAELRTRFEVAYAQLFARIIPGAEIEILSWSVVAGTAAERPVPPPVPSPATAPAPRAMRRVFEPGLGRTIDMPIFLRAEMAPGARISGPALIAEDETTTFVTARFDAAIDGARSIVLSRKPVQS
jgi:N-methylhydantoinase A